MFVTRKSQTQMKAYNLLLLFSLLFRLVLGRRFVRPKRITKFTLRLVKLHSFCFFLIFLLYKKCVLTDLLVQPTDSFENKIICCEQNHLW